LALFIRNQNIEDDPEEKFPLQHAVGGQSSNFPAKKKIERKKYTNSPSDFPVKHRTLLKF
jgi:hypothetical protein